MEVGVGKNLTFLSFFSEFLPIIDLPLVKFPHGKRGIMSTLKAPKQ